MQAYTKSDSKSVSFDEYHRYAYEDFYELHLPFDGETKDECSARVGVVIGRPMTRGETIWEWAERLGYPPLKIDEIVANLNNKM